MLDPLGVVTKTRAAVTEGASGPADAPTTIVHNEEMQRQQQENYFYVPDIGDVPEIAVPDFLPNLLGEFLFFVCTRTSHFSQHAEAGTSGRHSITAAFLQIKLRLKMNAFGQDKTIYI